MARIQTFPDNLFSNGSKSKQMAQVGNAVPLRERTLFEKVIIHIGLFPLPVLFIFISYSINNLNDN